jgi:hypothetical protein
VGKTDISESQPSLEDFTRCVYSVVIYTIQFFGFHNGKLFNGERSSALRPTLNLVDLVSVRSPKDRVAHLYPQAPGSLFYGSQSYGLVITTFLQAVLWLSDWQNMMCSSLSEKYTK